VWRHRSSWISTPLQLWCQLSFGLIRGNDVFSSIFVVWVVVVVGFFFVFFSFLVFWWGFEFGESISRPVGRKGEKITTKNRV
jgi:hypothetical protein